MGTTAEIIAEARHLLQQEGMLVSDRAESPLPRMRTIQLPNIHTCPGKDSPACLSVYTHTHTRIGTERRGTDAGTKQVLTDWA